ncbi:hypothetical protein B0H17DRAFT_853042, partial [Mycena rosella]
TLATVLLLSLINLGIAAVITSAAQNYLEISFPYSALAIATSVITMATVPAMIALEILRPGGVTSMIIFELGWLSFLWIMWLATGAQAASIDLGDGVDVPDDPTTITDDPTMGICRETSAIVALAFLNWFILMGYTTTILIMSLMAASRKQTAVWQSSV